MKTFLLIITLFTSQNTPTWQLQRNHAYVSFEDCADTARHWVTEWEKRSGLKASWTCAEQTQTENPSGQNAK